MSLLNKYYHWKSELIGQAWGQKKKCYYLKYYLKYVHFEKKGLKS